MEARIATHPQHLVAQAAAENLQIVEDLVVNKEQRIPDIAYFSTKPDPASTATNLLLHGQEFHTSYWGHLGLLNLTRTFSSARILPPTPTLPRPACFPPTRMWPTWRMQQHALVGYVHPYDSVPDPAKDASLTHELPVDLALGKVDYIEVMGFAEHKSTANVWYRLLNCGFHLPTAAGTDAMANFASLRGPVGLNRVYAKVPAGPLNIGTWLDSIKHGRTFATNGPLLGFSLGGKQLGDELRLPAGENKVKFTRVAAIVRAYRSSAGDLQWRGGARFEAEWRPRDGRRGRHDSDFTQRMVLAAGLEREGGASGAGYVSLRDYQPDLCDGRGVASQACRRRRIFRRLDRSHD